MDFESISRTHVGLRRKLNEDSVLDASASRIWAIADGMGGHDAGEVASRMVVDTLSRSQLVDCIETRLTNAVNSLEEVNSTLVDMARAGFRHSVIGSTVVGLIVNQAKFGCFWAGDSRGFHVRDGKIAQITRDHSLVQDLVDAGMIQPHEAEDHPNANVITRAVGAADSLQVDTVEGEMCSGDTFLLASDGLTRLVSDQELRDELTSPELAAAADRLVELAL